MTTMTILSVSRHTYPSAPVLSPHMCGTASSHHVKRRRARAEHVVSRGVVGDVKTHFAVFHHHMLAPRLHTPKAMLERRATLIGSSLTIGCCPKITKWSIIGSTTACQHQELSLRLFFESPNLTTELPPHTPSRTGMKESMQCRPSAQTRQRNCNHGPPCSCATSWTVGHATQYAHQAGNH